MEWMERGNIVYCAKDKIYRPKKSEDGSIARGNDVGVDLQLCFKGHNQIISTRLDI